MCKLVALFMALFFSAITLLFPSQANSPTRGTIDLKPRDSDWVAEIAEEYEKGSPKIVIFYEASFNSKEGVPVKKMEYDSAGALASETDLIYLESIHPVAKQSGCRMHSHGAHVQFFSSGEVARTFVYDKGTLHGPAREYYPNGIVKSKLFYENGLKQGLGEFFYENGNLKESTEFFLGQLCGKNSRWSAQGLLKAEYNYVNGLLSDNKDRAAWIEYFANKKIKREKHYLNGQAHGLHRKYDEDGCLRHNVVYFFGNKNGLESYYFKDQKIEGEGRYIKGRPVGRHYRKHANGVDALVAFYDSLGNLKDAIVEYDHRGKLRAEYRFVDSEKEGKFLEWSPGEILKKEYHYESKDFEFDVSGDFSTMDIKLKLT